MRRHASHRVVLGAISAVLLAGTLPAAAQERFIDVGAPGDEAFVGEGLYNREGPYDWSKLAFARENSFRWMSNDWTLRLPVFPRRHNAITFRLRLSRRVELSIPRTDWKAQLLGVSDYRLEQTVGVPREVVGDKTELVLQGHTLKPVAPGGRDKRTLVAMLDWIKVRVVDNLPPATEVTMVHHEPDYPLQNRLRGVEARPSSADIDAFVTILRDQRANVVTIGPMNGQWIANYPSKYAPRAKNMDPEWIPGVIKACHEAGIDVIGWLPFNCQDLRKVEQLEAAKKYPQWTMKFIEYPGKQWLPRVGMCVVSSPYREEHAKVLREAASFDLDGVFFDGFYLSGIPHPSRAGCTCKWCQEKFKRDTGLELPKVVDWNELTFKKWVRWRNHQIVETAKYFQAEMRKVNPDLLVTCNYNIWPFGHKDWETAIPCWKTTDYGVSQHAYSGTPELEWIMLGFKSRVSHDLNPRHCDIWRTARQAFKYTGTPEDDARHELTMKTFMLAGVTYGVTPWHGGHIPPPDAGRRIHEAIAQREPYFSQDDVLYAGVVLSQNTHDFYGHIPGTENLTLYQDAILGTWLLLTEQHVPFAFVFDNQLEEGSLDEYQVLVLTDTACLSENAVRQLTKWVEAGGHLVCTFETSLYDEWGQKREDFGLKDLLGVSAAEARPAALEAGQVRARPQGRGKVVYLPFEPGLAYARERSEELSKPLLEAIGEVEPPLEIEAPASIAANALWGPERKSVLVQLLNVSAFMPGGDTGFRGLGRPAAPPKDTASDGDIKAGGRVRRVNVPARDIVIRPRAWPVKRATLVLHDQELRRRADGGYVVPVLGDHEIVKLEIDG